MKKLAGLLLAFVCILSLPKLGWAQVNSCLYSKISDSVYTNPDSVARDTCTGSATYNHWYSKRYEAYFKVDAFHLGYGNPDSVLIVHLEDIDTTYSALRDSFHSIYTKWGAFYFQKIHPEDTSRSYEGYKIIFHEYLLSQGGVVDDLSKIETDGLVEISFNTPVGPPNNVNQYDNRQLSFNILDNVLHVKLSSGLSTSSVQLFDLSGKKVFDLHSLNQQQISISTHGIATGMYFLVCDNMSAKLYIQ